MRFVSDWLANLPRPIAVALTVSGFLILINVFTGLHRIWFHWPVAALLFIGILRTVLPAQTCVGQKRGAPTESRVRWPASIGKSSRLLIIRSAVGS